MKGSRTKMFLKKDVLQKFRDRKTSVLESLFNKGAGLKVFNLMKKRPQHRCFHVNILEYLRAAFFIEHLRWLLLSVR